jgi:hypothetical protein
MPENNLIHLANNKELQSSIANLIPKANMFIDPYFPGFGLIPLDKFEKLSLNLANNDIKEFILNIRTPNIQNELKLFQESFLILNRYGTEISEELKVAITDFFENNINAEDLTYMIRVIVVMNMDNPQFASLFNDKFIIYIDRFIDTIELKLLNVASQVKAKQTITSTKELIDLVNKSLIQAFYDHWFSIIKSHETGKIPNISIDKLLTINFVCEFLSDHSNVNRLRNNLFCYKADISGCFKEMLSYFNRIPHSMTNLSYQNPLSFLSALPTRSDDFILIDGFSTKNSDDIIEMINIALLKNLKILLIKPQSLSLSHDSKQSIKTKDTFEFDHEIIELSINY